MRVGHWKERRTMRVSNISNTIKSILKGLVVLGDEPRGGWIDDPPLETTWREHDVVELELGARDQVERAGLGPA